MGNIAHKQEKFSDAHQYFRNATEINQRSAILQAYYGMTLSNCDQLAQALVCFEKAEQLDSKRPLIKF
jgi:tetratricopeptide (TPR) repeat protein